MNLKMDDLLHRGGIDSLVVAGWTGRNEAAVRRHIEELEQLGVKRPSMTPCFYRLSRTLLTIEPEIDVIGEHSSGEVEFVLAATGEELYVGVGSDHTDRRLEAYDVATSKQLCPKPISPVLWSLKDIIGHWDQLVLRAHLYVGGRRVLYQHSSVAAICQPYDLIKKFTGRDKLPSGTVMFCGTVPAISDYYHGSEFEVELVDPVRNMKINHSYRVRELS